MKTVSMNVKGDEVIVSSPYNSSFLSKAKALRGKWNSVEKTWIFPTDLLKEVQDLLRSIYGFGEETVDVEIRLKGRIGQASLRGRNLLSRKYRDGRVLIGDGVSVLDGEFSDSGGSCRYPAVGEFDGTLLVRDVPKSHLVEVEKIGGWQTEVSYEIRKKNGSKNPYDSYSREELEKMKALIEEALSKKE